MHHVPFGIKGRLWDSESSKQGNPLIGWYFSQTIEYIGIKAFFFISLCTEWFYVHSLAVKGHCVKAKHMHYELGMLWIKTKPCIEFKGWSCMRSTFFQGTRWNQILKGHLNFDCCLTGTFSAIAQNSQEFQLTQVTLKLNHWKEFLKIPINP